LVCPCNSIVKLIKITEIVSNSNTEKLHVCKNNVWVAGKQTADVCKENFTSWPLSFANAVVKKRQLNQDRTDTNEYQKGCLNFFLVFFNWALKCVFLKLTQPIFIYTCVMFCYGGPLLSLFCIIMHQEWSTQPRTKSPNPLNL
jgi:hypothetical protein